MRVVICTLLISLSAFAGAETDPWFAFEENGKWGYRGEGGKTFIAPKFEYADSVYRDWALVRMEGKYGMLGYSRDWLMPCKYDTLFWVARGFATKRNGEWTVSDPYRGDTLAVNLEAVSHLGWPCIGIKRNGKWQLLNERNAQIPLASFDEIRSFGRYMGEEVALAPARLGDKWGYIDYSAEFRIPAKFEDARSFCRPGWAAVKQNELWGLIRPNGTWVLEPQWEQIGEFSREYFWPYIPVEQNGQWGLADSLGNLIVECEQDSAFLNEFEEIVHKYGYYLIRWGDKWGYSNRYGEHIRPQYDSLVPWNDVDYEVRPLANVKVDSFWGILNSDNTFAVVPAYEQMRTPIGPALFPVQLNGKWGLIDRFGETVIEPEWDDIGTMASWGYKYYIPVKRENKWGYFVPDEGLRVPCQFDSAVGFGRIDSWFASGLGPVLMDGKWGYTGFKGEIVIPCIYDSIYCGPISHGRTNVWLNGEALIIDTVGTILERR